MVCYIGAFKGLVWGLCRGYYGVFYRFFCKGLVWGLYRVLFWGVIQEGTNGQAMTSTILSGITSRGPLCGSIPSFLASQK